jgi:ubiquinol-cytochrome c reductase cytochrome c1 subunit
MLKRAMLAPALVFALLNGGQASAAENGVELIDKSWNHEGLFGTIDRASAQRGFQVYREVCSGCHGMDYLAFRNLEDIGFSEEQVQALASEYTITDGPDDAGEMYEREARPSDRIPSPYANEGQARAANGGAYPPDLSLITKARAEGSDYVYSLMRGYVEPPPDAEEGLPGLYYNAYFPGHWIAMPQPIYEEGVTYADGTEPTLEQMSADVTTFLTWAAEPKLEERKQAGLKVTLFLIILTGLLYATKKKIWADVH